MQINFWRTVLSNRPSNAIHKYSSQLKLWIFGKGVSCFPQSEFPVHLQNVTSFIIHVRQIDNKGNINIWLQLNKYILQYF